nr:transporter [Sphingobium terrigena]
MSSQIEVADRVSGRRRWSVEQKLAILRDAFGLDGSAPGVTGYADRRARQPAMVIPPSCSPDRRLAAMLGAIGIDILIDGLVLGLAFVAGAKAGLLLTIALTLEVLFLGLTVTAELGETVRSRRKVIAITAALALLLPVGALVATPVAAFPPIVIAGFLSFGLMALLYLVTEELLVEAHERPDSPLISAMFFVGFLGLLLIEEIIG